MDKNVVLMPQVDLCMTSFEQARASIKRMLKFLAFKKIRVLCLPEKLNSLKNSLSIEFKLYFSSNIFEI